MLIVLIGLPACSTLSPSTKSTQDPATAGDTTAIDSSPVASAPDDVTAVDAAAAPAVETTAHVAAKSDAESTAAISVPPFAPAARVQRIAPFRHVSEFMSVADWQNLKADTVGLKICAPSKSAETTVEVADPSPLAMLNDAAIAWGKASRWQVVNGEGASFPVCTFVVARFGR